MGSEGSSQRRRNQRRPGPGLSLNWDDKSGWGIVFSAFGATLTKIGFSSAMLYNTALCVAGVGLAASSLVVIAGLSVAVCQWASSGREDDAMPLLTTEMVNREKRQHRLDPDHRHIAVCGPAGSGKTSMINALRGLKNSHPDAASTGSAETTRSVTGFTSHASFDHLKLYDFPGAGTLRVPASGYYRTQRLYLFDCVLIICGERFGEVEVEVLKSCISRGQRFAIVRSRSDEVIARTMKDREVGFNEAKCTYLKIMLDAITAELQRAGLEEENVPEILGFLVLVNNDSLRELTMSAPYDWPNPAADAEISERQLLEFLGKVGVAKLVDT